MSTDHARDDWTDARTGEALQRSLHSLAGVAATASSLDSTLGSVTTRVRRRRAAKQAGLGATALAMTAGLVVGGAALVPEDPLVLPPPPAGTPSQSVSPEPAPEPEPSDTVDAEPTDGPDGTASTQDETEPAVDCSAAGAGGSLVDAADLPAPVRETADTLLAAALACDEQTLVDLNIADDTATNLGGRSPQEFWGLPDAEEFEDVYAILAGLLTETRWATQETDQGTVYLWPRVHTAEWADSDEAWQEAIDAGAVDAKTAEEMRGAEGYLGWRLGITEDGSWQYFVGGD